MVAVAFLMEAIDTTILNTAVPTIADALGVVPLSMKSVLSSYTLSLAVFIPVSGWIADRFGTRRVFATAIGIFTLGSLLCGLATNIHVLVACRILQGMGGALMVPVGRLTIVRTFERSELVRAMTFVTIPALIGPMLGPVAGGLIVGYLHWRVIFFVNLPIGLLGLALVFRRFPNYRADHVAKLDVLGGVLFGSGIGLLSYILEVFGEHTLSLSAILGLFALSAALLAAYFRHAITAAHPLLQLGLFRLRTFRSSVVGSFITRLGAGGIPFLLPLLYQVGLGYTAVQSAFLLMPQSIAAMGVRTAMPRILGRFGYRRVLLANTVLIGLAIALFATVGAGTPVAVIVLFSLDLRRRGVAPVREHEHARVRRRRGARREHGEHDLEHDAADVAELRRRRRVARDGPFHPGPVPVASARAAPRDPPRPSRSRRHDRPLGRRVPGAETGRRGQHQPARRRAHGLNRAAFARDGNTTVGRA